MGFAQVVLQVRAKPCSIRPKRFGDFPAVQIRALLAVLIRDTKINRHIFESVGGKFARGDVVKLDQQIRVHHRAPGQITTRKIDPSLGDLEATIAKRSLLPEAPPGAGHFVSARALTQEIEIEFKDIVPLDHIGIDLSQSGVELE